ncbi:MAG: phosphodiester glycosidase family protein [Clostridiaceae bacterium]|nr:phosphodiester glycosidase family protein [Clostridiaceae bacterium]
MPKKKKSKVKVAIFFIVYMLLFTCVTAPFYVYRGPFTCLKTLVVGTIMGTRHQYLTTAFLSTTEINKITNKNIIVEEEKEVKVTETDLIVPKANASNSKIVRYNLHPDSGRYDGYLLEIPDPTKVKVAYSKKLKVEGQKTSEMAKDHNAVAAINGGAFSDNYDSQGTFGGAGAFPGGFVISKGEIIFNDSNNNKTQSVTALTSSGTLIVGNYSVNELKKLNVTEALCFRPPVLIIKGKGQVTNQDVAKYGLQPRTAIGQTANGTILLLVMDGRENIIKSGASLKDVQDELLRRGAITASNLDGGFSSTMYYDGELVNSPHGWNGERYVATSIIVEP